MSEFGNRSKDLKADCKQLEVSSKASYKKVSTTQHNYIFCLENVKQKLRLVKFYIGFPDFDTLMILMVLSVDDQINFSLLKQFFMILVRLHLELPK